MKAHKTTSQVGGGGDNTPVQCVTADEANFATYSAHFGMGDGLATPAYDELTAGCRHCLSTQQDPMKDCRPK